MDMLFLLICGKLSVFGLVWQRCRLRSAVVNHLNAGDFSSLFRGYSPGELWIRHCQNEKNLSYPRAEKIAGYEV